MKKLLSVFALCSFIVLLIQCGGPKQLSQEELDQMPTQERLAELEKYVEKKPEDLEAKKRLYREYLANGMEVRAIPLIRDVLAAEPYQSDVQYEYGNLMYERGEQKVAYQAYLDALKAPGGTYYLNNIAEKLGSKYLVQQATNNSADEAFPTFSPDGSKIIFQSKQSGNWDIMELELSSGNISPVLNTPFDEELPYLSPNGKLLVYTSNVDDKRPIDDRFKVREVYRKELATGFTANLTETIADDWLPRFSHDGAYILFTSERSDLRKVPYTEKKSDVYMMESDGDFHKNLTQSESNDGGACFTMSNGKILFHSNRNGTYDIFKMDADGSNPILLFGNPDYNEVNPFVSPDSHHVVFFADKGGNYDIFMAKTDGSEIEQLTSNPAVDTDPVFSPDGKMIAFHSNRSGNFDIYVINLSVQSETTVDGVTARLNELLNQ